MKPSASLLSFLFFLFFIASVISAEVVLDSNGEMMRNGGKYYLSPINSVGGGAITSAAVRHGDNLCSLAVVSALYTKGQAVTISSPYRAAFIQTSSPLNLKFAYLPPNACTNSPHWVVVRSRRLREAVMLGDKQEFGNAFVSGSLSIETYDTEKHHYKLVFCEQGNDECRNIGVKLDDEDRRRLVVTDKEALIFKFDRVKGNSNCDLSMVD